MKTPETADLTGATVAPSRACCHRSLALHLQLVTALVLTVTGAVIIGVITLMLRWGPDLLTDLSLKNNASQVIKGLQFDQNDRPYRTAINDKDDAAYEILKADSVYRILDEQGRVLLASDGITQPYAEPGNPFTPAPARLKLHVDGRTLHVLTRQFEHGGRNYYVQVMRSERLLRIIQDDKGQRLTWMIIVGAIVCALLFSIVVAVTLHHLLKPLRRAANAAATIDIDNLSARLSVQDVPREITPLFHSVNLALDRLEQGYRQQRDFLATAAHELKTPLTLMRGQVELGDVTDGEVLLQDIDRMARQVQQLLTLAEASERHNYSMQQTAPQAAWTQAASQLERLAQQMAVKVVIGPADSAPPSMILADPGALGVLCKNLLENALHHSPPGGTVTLHANARRLSVRDEGPGIAEDALPHLFERFWRGPHRRDQGAGLGLSICAEIAQAHGWEITADNGPRGAVFEVRFNPAASARPA